MTSTKIIKATALALTLNATFAYADCNQGTLSNVIRRDNIEQFVQYQQKCHIPHADARGITLGERASLYGATNILNYLKQHKQINTSMSLSMGKLVQTGLRYLGYDAGIIDGHFGKQTVDAIKAFQKTNHLTQTGKINANWLHIFNRKIIASLQKDLATLGFDAGTADGIIGDNTRTAMQAFRKERQIPVRNYAEVDDQILYQLMMMEHEKHKKLLAKKEAERKARQIAQEAERKQEIARRRAEAEKKALERRRQAERQAQASAQAAKARLNNSQNVLRQNLPPNEPVTIGTRSLTTIPPQANDALHQHDSSAVQARAEAARQAELEAKAQAREAQQAADKARLDAQRALENVKNNRPVTVSPEVAAQHQISGAKPVAGGFLELTGILRHSSPSSCTINGQKIGESWCESYYPQNNGKRCTAVMSQTGLVISLLCE